jgi:energy-coupling factor transporter ATP-binding protein EcfA2
MKLLELKIHNFRGIINLSIKPDGKNFLIYGPNGSGKSAVVDALDFLLTGQISRMTGKGTKGITLKKHGHHVDYSPEDSDIMAKVQIHGFEEPVEIKRNLATPNELICDDSVMDIIKPVLELASRGQHVLTRREILNYVNADSGTRGKQIQSLLKITDVEETRSKLVKVRNTLKNNYDAARSSLNTISAAINSNIGIKNFDEEKILDFVNLNRKILGGIPLEELKSDILKEDIAPQVLPSDMGINTQLLKNDLDNLQNIKSDRNRKNIGNIDFELRDLKTKISSDHNIGDALDHLKLTRLGLDLLGPEGSCPLCDTLWETGNLKDHLENKIEVLTDAAEKLDRMIKLSDNLILEVNHVLAILYEITKSAEILELKEEINILKNWINDLDIFLSVLEDDKYPDPKFNIHLVEVLLAPVNLPAILDTIYSAAIEISPEPSKEQTAWDNLTRLEENLKNYEKSTNDCDKSFESYKKGEILLNTFLESRNSILNNLFAEIKDRFVELYRELHGIDEIEFDALLVSEGAGVDFKVDFHGRGVNPPHALHSEGHQDSMGICLYLALAERLTQGFIDLIILDDVMMSVDAPHRREICNLLANFFKGRQFFITTHDQTWARQLQSEGVIQSKNRIEFSNWTIENGPSMNIMGDIWEGVDYDLERNDIPSAAAKLRRGSEEYFSQVCASLQAPVRFKFNGQYELGDLLSGAMNEYNSQLKHAKKAANSWGNTEELEKLKDIEIYSKGVFDKINAERWLVNPAVHYNEGADFTLEDFKPVVETFHDLFSIFQCEKCGTFIHLVINGPRAEAVKCNCGHINWNLMDK